MNTRIHLHMRRVNDTDNAFRDYIIRYADPGSRFELELFFGRIGRKMKRKVLTCNDADGVLREAERRFLDRLRHGYRIVAIDADAGFEEVVNRHNCFLREDGSDVSRSLCEFNFLAASKEWLANLIDSPVFDSALHAIIDDRDPNGAEKNQVVRQDRNAPLLPGIDDHIKYVNEMDLADAELVVASHLLSVLLSRHPEKLRHCSQVLSLPDHLDETVSRLPNKPNSMFLRTHLCELLPDSPEYDKIARCMSSAGINTVSDLLEASDLEGIELSSYDVVILRRVLKRFGIDLPRLRPLAC